MRHDLGAGHRARTGDVARKALLACGIVASLLYGTIDLLAGLQYDGYSFFSQTISELGAIGAPKPSFLQPLFLTYVVLMVVFAIVVLLEGRRGNGALRIVGALLLAYMLAGSGTGFFPVHVRGTATVADELPHIISGLVATTVILVTMGIGSVALGTRFRKFSWAMVATILVFGALTVPNGMRLAAGEPTPAMGLTERIAYYAILAWIGVLSIALVRRASAAGGRP